MYWGWHRFGYEPLANFAQSKSVRVHVEPCHASCIWKRTHRLATRVSLRSLRNGHLGLWVCPKPKQFLLVGRYLTRHIFLHGPLHVQQSVYRLLSDHNVILLLSSHIFSVCTRLLHRLTNPSIQPLSCIIHTQHFANLSKQWTHSSTQTHPAE
jgi:hypothetical protein